MPKKPILKLIIEKIATSLNNDKFFSNKRILAIFLQIHSSPSPYSWF